jgi:hypothetical protein
MLRYGIVIAVLCSCASARANEPAKIDFNRQVQPILSGHCYKCHGPDDKSREASLRLDRRESATAEAESGALPIVPGKPAESELVLRIRATDGDMLMPPAEANKPLTDAQKQILEQWIAEGAEYEAHWAFVPPRQASLPAVKQTEWPKNAIDYFILARLEAEGLTPSPEADRHTLARRAALDLVGLPPTPEEADAFVADTSSDAYERYVDRLLASPSYGERWARRWLDLARYADTNGYEKDRVRSMWPYRDWVIDALNADMPFDQFTIKQIAGDLLPHATLEDRIATGFHRNTMINEEGGVDPLEFRYHSMIDRVATTATTWLGLTMACAQCHTHKYDPIPHQDFYRMMAFLNNADELEMDVPKPDITARRAELQAQIDAAVADLKNQFPTEGDLRWHDAQPTRVESEAGSTVAIQEDGAVLISGANPESDVYTVTLESPAPRVSTIELMALTDASLGGNGPGRTPHGNFVVTEINVTAAPLDGSSPPREIKPTQAETNFAQDGFPAAHAIDGNPRTGWAIHGKNKWNVNRILTLGLEQPIDFAGGTRWTFRIAQQYGGHHTLGRFRIRLGEPLNDPRPIEQRRQEHLAHRFKEWVASEGARTGHWRLLKPLSATSEIPVLTILDDDSVLATADQSKSDTYHIRLACDLQGVTALRLEAMVDDRLPVRGPGRIYYEGPFGDFYLSTFAVQSGGQPAPFRSATHSFASGAFTAATAVDADPQTGWSINGAQGRSHSAVFVFEQPLNTTGEIDLRMLFERYYAAGMGRFRIWATTDPAPAPARDLPIAVDERLLQAGAAPDPDQHPALLDHFLSVAPEMAAARAKIDALRAQMPAYPTTLVFAERPVHNPRATFVHPRGEYLQRGDAVTAEIPSLFDPLDPAAPRDRLTFARWLVDPQNPLVGRVTMNRQWAVLFGRGIVSTTEDFGYQGQRPTHPALLDWLAVELVNRGWSLKQMHRLIVTSATYRQSSRTTPELLNKDPENRLLARAPRVRFDAEMVRDAVLKASGLLSSKLGGPSVFPPQPPGITSEGAYGPLEWKVSTGEDRYRRGLYTFAKRTAPYAMFNTFDAPSGEACVARRDESNTPLQALTLLNDEVFVEAAQALGDQLARQSGTVEERVTNLFRRCLARSPSEAERVLLTDFHQHQLDRLTNKEIDAAMVASAGGDDAIARAGWTLTARAVLNLDEMITKE